MTLIVCSTVAAITTHLREVTNEHPLSLSGHHPQPLSLCGMNIAWDTKLPISSARCNICRSKRALLEAKP